MTRFALTPVVCALLATACIDSPALPALDAGATACDPLADACSPEEACQRVEAGTFACGPAGVAGDQEACSSSAPCERGFICASPPDGDQQLCLGLCREDSDCPQQAGLEQCTLAFQQGGDPALCQRMRPCEPLIVPVSCAPWEKCSLARLPGPFVCLPSGTLGDYAVCAREADCAPGFACVRYGDTSTMRCASFCAADLDCPQAGGLELCLRRNQPDQPPILCERATRCTPSAHQCPGGEACYPYRTSSSELSSVEGICRTAGSRAQGESCASLNECAKGLACVEPLPGAGATCRAICSLDGTVRCPAGQGCMPITRNFGACT
ncbi:MAG: hypothetical protein HY901_08240 [Deltaproteobacteria bacterium]|nr:hypothetical protein [Deltaproteobacteria bacterium]